MPQIGDAIPPNHVPASTEELARIVGRNTIGAGTAPKRRGKASKPPRRKPHTATHGPVKA